MDTLKWAIANNHIKAPELPKDKHGLDFYTDLYGNMAHSLEEYRENFPRLIELYKQEHPEFQESGIDISIPKEPPRWPIKFGVFNSQSFVDTKLGNSHNFFHLSPLGMIWRGETMRGIIDTFNHLQNEPALLAYMVLNDNLMERYFWETHKLAYMQGQVGIQNLPFPDYATIILNTVPHPRNTINPHAPGFMLNVGWKMARSEMERIMQAPLYRLADITRDMFTQCRDEEGAARLVRQVLDGNLKVDSDEFKRRLAEVQNHKSQPEKWIR